MKTKEKERQRVAGGPPVFLPHLFPLALFCLRWHHRATSTALATRDFNYFLIRSFQPGLAGASRHNASQLLTHAERQLAPPATTPLPPPACHAAPSSVATASIGALVVFFLPFLLLGRP